MAQQVNIVSLKHKQKKKQKQNSPQQDTWLKESFIAQVLVIAMLHFTNTTKSADTSQTLRSQLIKLNAQTLY